MKLALAQDTDRSNSWNFLPLRILALTELDTPTATPNSLTLVDWAPPTTHVSDVKLLTQALPPGSALVLTGDNAALPAWRTLTHGDLCTLRDGCGLRSLAVELDPRMAIERCDATFVGGGRNHHHTADGCFPLARRILHPLR